MKRLLFLFIPLIVSLGCSSAKPEVVSTVAQGTISLEHYRGNMDTILTQFIAAEHDRGIAAADAAYTAAVQSHIKADGSIDLAIIQAHEIQRARNYLLVEKARSDALAKVAAASQDGANAARYLGALGDYFQAQATNAATTQQISQSAVDALTALIDRWQAAKIPATPAK